jgi:phospholipid/cholesterol/gamma-HCH transport system ATP-binding protein
MTPVLEFVGARIVLDAGLGASAPLSFALRPGDLTLIDPQGAARAMALADAAAGRQTPESGAVRLAGRDWTTMSDAEAATARGRIGRCFVGGGWLSHLSVLENLTLSARHHEAASARAIEAQANALAQRFGLPGVPTTLPMETDPADLARAALAGAFLGRPVLVVLEEPRRGLPPDITPALVRAVRAVRDRGGAVLWLTTGGALSEAALPATQRFRLASGRLISTRAEVPESQSA